LWGEVGCTLSIRPMVVHKDSRDCKMLMALEPHLFLRVPGEKAPLSGRL
jgi:hypothetical protein